MSLTQMCQEEAALQVHYLFLHNALVLQGNEEISEVPAFNLPYFPISNSAWLTESKSVVLYLPSNTPSWTMTNILLRSMCFLLESTNCAYVSFTSIGEFRWYSIHLWCKKKSESGPFTLRPVSSYTATPVVYQPKVNGNDSNKIENSDCRWNVW